MTLATSLPATHQSQGLRVLVVDDEALIRWSVGEGLAAEGHQVSLAGDAATALKIVAESRVPFDVAIIDLRLPDTNDLTLLAALRRLAPSTRIILMTAYGSPATRQGALQLGASRVVIKPLDIDDLAGLVADAHAASPLPG